MAQLVLSKRREELDNDVALKTWATSKNGLMNYVKHCQADAYFIAAISIKVQMLPLTKVLTNLAGKHRLIVDVGLDPRHELLDVGRGRHLGRLLVVFAVLPEVLEPGVVSRRPRVRERAGAGAVVAILIRCLHLGARLRGAKLGNGAVEQVDLVVKVDHFGDKSATASALRQRQRPAGAAAARGTHC